MSKRIGKAGPILADWHLWAEVKRTVTPLRAEPAKPFSQRMNDAPLPLPPAERPPPAFDKTARWTGPSLPAYRAPQPAPRPADRSIDPRLRRRLQRGQLAIDATIDLHGMRQDEARSALRHFIGACLRRGDRTVLVITGKGLGTSEDLAIRQVGVLRAMLPVWLSEPDLAPVVAGWDAAARGHGGAGAFYVRLRRGGVR